MQVGFIGTGNMGRHMAANLIKGGHKLTVHDKRKEATDELVAQGAQWADTPKAVAGASQVTITSLPGPAEVEVVALRAKGIFEGAGKGHVYIDMSTNAPNAIRRIAAIGAAKGIDVLDAPVSGGVRGARQGKLTIMVGGNQAAFEACQPVFKCMGEHIFLVGGNGAGCVAKLVNNTMVIGNAIVSMEAMVMGAKAGVDIRRLFEVVDSCTGTSYVFKGLYPYQVFKGKFDPPSFALSLAAKDLRLAVNCAQELGVPAELARHTYDLLAGAVEKGMGEKDVAAFITLLEKAAGVELRTKDA